MSVLNLDAEQGGGYNYDETEAELQAFSDKAVINWYEIIDLSIFQKLSPILFSYVIYIFI